MAPRRPPGGILGILPEFQSLHPANQTLGPPAKHRSGVHADTKHHNTRTKCEGQRVLRRDNTVSTCTVYSHTEEAPWSHHSHETGFFFWKTWVTKGVTEVHFGIFLHLRCSVMVYTLKAALQVSFKAQRGLTFHFSALDNFFLVLFLPKPAFVSGSSPITVKKYFSFFPPPPTVCLLVV